MITSINTNKSPYVKYKNHKSKVMVLVIYMTWAISILFTYRLIFTRYGVINSIIMSNRIYDKEIKIKNLSSELNLIKNKIKLIKDNDIDLLEELSIQLLNRIPPNAKVLVK